MTTLRPRRVLLLCLLVCGIVGLSFLRSLPLPAQTYLSASSDDAPLPDEIFGLLWFLVAPEESSRTIVTEVHDESKVTDERTGIVLGGPVNPAEPIDIAWYALGSIAVHGVRDSAPLDGGGALLRPGSAKWRWDKVPVRDKGGWEERMRVLRDEYPLVVISKTRCPYSASAKKLLESYDMSPPPKIIEVDERADMAHIKTLLTRLTHHTTFPNIILHGHSLGGSDDLARMNAEGVLRGILEEAGLRVGWRVEPWSVEEQVQ